MKKKFLFSLLAISMLFVSCFEDLDDNLQQASTIEIQDFIYRGLNFFYLYKADTPELANDAFATNADKNAFLSSFDSPEALFAYLKSPQDRFSILVDNYIELENALSGVTLNNGMEYGLVFYSGNSGNVFGYVRYVLPNSDADTKGIKRGDIFNTVNGTQITASNFGSLLAPDSYTIGLATISGQDIVPTGETVELVKEQYTENPIFIANTLNIGGENIGYLMYNAFTGDFDPQLNNAFGNFQADGVTKLVLDLRYNGGGSVRTAQDLASMITGQFAGQLFYTEQWNEDRQEEYAENGVFNTTLRNGTNINSLNLSSVYIITSGSTASASELVINSLKPYINVIQIGTNTTGKFQASFLLYDAPAPQFSRSEANPAHTYAMLPLVFKTANANGVTDFVDGLTPDIEQSENFANLGILGDPDEPLLARALEDIFPSQPKSYTDFEPLTELSESKADSPIYQIMIAEK